MKRKKIVKYLLLVFVSIFILNTNNTKANTVNENTGGGASGAGSSSNTQQENRGKYQVKVRLVYYKDGNLIKTYHTEYWGINGSSKPIPAHYSGISAAGQGNEGVTYRQMTDADISYFCGKYENLECEEGYAATEWFKTHVPANEQLWETEPADRSQQKIAQTGIRIIIEPIFHWKINGERGHYITTKEVCSMGAGYKNRCQSDAQFYFTEFTDVGISAGRTAENCKNSDMGTLASTKNGCGYHIIDITNVIEPPCKYVDTTTGEETTKDIKICVKDFMEGTNISGKNPSKHKYEHDRARKECVKLICRNTCDRDKDGQEQDISNIFDQYLLSGLKTTAALGYSYIDAGCYRIPNCGCNCYGKQEMPNVEKNTIKSWIKTWADQNKLTLVGFGTSLENNLKPEFLKQCKNTDFATKSCKYDVVVNDKLKCTNKIQNKKNINVGYERTEDVDVRKCQDVIALGNKVGKLGECNIYCKEKAHIILPGHVDEVLKPGTSIEWPVKTNFDSFESNIYKMNIETTLECKVVHPTDDDVECGSLGGSQTAIKGLLENFEYENSAGLKYNDNDYGNTNKKAIDLNISGKIDESGKKYSISKYENRNYSVFTGRKNFYDGDKFLIKADLLYSLAKGLNRQIDGDGIYYNNRVINGAMTMYGPNHSRVLPLKNTKTETLAISRNADGEYELNLYINLGIKNQLKKSLEGYKCNYKVDDDTTDQCICPEGTINAGRNIAELMMCIGDDSNNNAHYCEEAQIKLCNSNIDEVLNEEKCICKYDGEEVDLRSCMSEGNSFEYCYRKKCPSQSKCKLIDENGNSNCEWKRTRSLESNNSDIKAWYKMCKNEDGENIKCGFDYNCPSCESPDDCDMNPTACVQSKLGQKNLEYALDKGWITQEQLNKALIACEQVVCPGIKNKIVYRVIDLDNPFPGMKANTIGNTDNSINMNVNGRQPGYNWNNKKWINDKIRTIKAKERKLDDSKKVYNETPLYIIELTPNDIKNIRNYNKENNYDDWKTLNCENGICVSKVLKETFKEILNGKGLCSGSLNPGDLRNCYENYSSSSSFATYISD